MLKKPVHAMPCASHFGARSAAPVPDAVSADLSHRSVVPGLGASPGRCPYRSALKLLILFDVSASVEVQVAKEFRLPVFE